VWVVGHGLFGPGTPWSGPSITQGHITKIARGERTRRAAVVQSSAAVHRGCSGGALVDAASGVLVGLVTTNVRHQDGVVMPHMNFSLPVHLLAPLEDFLGTSRGPGALELLVDAWSQSAADEQEQTLWRLETEPLDLPSNVELRRQQAHERMDKLAQEAGAKEKPQAGGPGHPSGSVEAAGQARPAPTVAEPAVLAGRPPRMSSRPMRSSL